MKRLIGSIVVLAGAFSSSLLFAQGWCWGWGPECISSTSQDTGGVIDEAPSYTPPTVITLPDSWGAIAQSPTTGLWAKASKQVSKQALSLNVPSACFLSFLLRAPQISFAFRLLFS